MPKTIVLEIASMQARAGIENYLMNMLREFDHGKIQVDFLCSIGESGPFDEEILSYGGRIFRVPGTGMSIIKVVRHFQAVKKILKEHPEITTVHIHANTAIGCLDARVAKAMKVPQIIVHSHSNDCKGFRRHLLHIVSKAFIRGCATRNFCCSDAAGKWMFGGNGKYYVMRNAICLSKYRFNPKIRDQIRLKNNWQDCKVIGHVGRMEAPKNHKLIIEVFNIIHKEHPETRLLLIGDGELRSKIRHQIVEYALQSDVIIVNQTDIVHEYLMAMDLFLFPSIWEGLGIALIEAQASGLPCLVSGTICDEVKITDLLHVCSLADDSATWAHYAWDLLNSVNDRGLSDNYIDQLAKAGYDVSMAAKQLSNIYISMSSQGVCR